MNAAPVCLFAPVEPADHGLGVATAPLTLVEYGDYQCTWCCGAYPIIKQLQQDRPGQIRFVFRHFPLLPLHSLSQLAAQAAEAAGAQGKFWEMHELLCERQSGLMPYNFIQYAAILNLDLERFGRAMREGAHVGRIAADVESGIRSGVTGAPAFFVNGCRAGEDWNRGNLRSRLEALLR